jgi:hypothetical protein
MEDVEGEMNEGRIEGWKMKKERKAGGKDGR